MKRSQGSLGISLVECINRYTGKYRIRWDIKEENNSEFEEKENNLVSFYETEAIFNKPPTLLEIKNAVYEAINRDTDEKILGGFIWNDMEVWLSIENQFNYKSAYDLAVQKEGETLPVTFKFGTTEEPVYHIFETLTELEEFYSAAVKYVSETLSAGWAMKDSIDWEDYRPFARQ